MQRGRATARFATSSGNDDKPPRRRFADLPELAKRRESKLLRRLKTISRRHQHGAMCTMLTCHYQPRPAMEGQRNQPKILQTCRLPYKPDGLVCACLGYCYKDRAIADSFRCLHPEAKSDHWQRCACLGVITYPPHFLLLVGFPIRYRAGWSTALARSGRPLRVERIMGCFDIVRSVIFSPPESRNRCLIICRLLTGALKVEEAGP